MRILAFLVASAGVATACSGSPVGGSAADGDGPASCGNGELDPGETCDVDIATGGAGACPSECNDGVACTHDALEGAGTCAATCAATPVAACVAGDGCCPAGCSPLDDGDCGTTCGNGVIDRGEACDTGIASGAPGACPTSCEDGLGCTTGALAGAGTCATACSQTIIATCSDGDGCCPPDCTLAADDDCVSTCGDGVVGPGETCDVTIAAGTPGACASACDDGNVCTLDDLGNPGTCAAACTSAVIDTCGGGDGCCPSGCTRINDDDCAAACGDGILDAGDAGEECDGTSLGGATCTSLGRGSGTLACDGACSYDLTGCTAPPLYDLSGATGCEGIYNPDQILSYELTLPAGDWQALLADATNSVYFLAQLSCEGGATIPVGVRRKRSGGTLKPGLKIDINEYAGGQIYYGLKKLSFEVGASSGGGAESAVTDLVAEYLSNRLVYLSGAIASRASFAQLTVNGQLIGVYVNVEQLDKTFLKDRLADDTGCLYKKSGGDTDGYQTLSSCPYPGEEYFCFWESNGCAVPSDIATTLPTRLDLDQMLRTGAVQALVANTDSPLFKDNNYLWYDWAGERIYLACDLDTTMKESSFSVFAGRTGGGGPPGGGFATILFPTWEDDYAIILTQLLAGPLTLTAIHAELDRALAVAGAALDADPAVTGGPAANAIGDLKTWWTARHADVTTEVNAH